MSNVIHVVRTFEAATTTLYDLWVASSTIVDPVTAVDFEAVPGGRLRLEAGSARLLGTVVEADRPTRLRYTWRWDDADEECIIDVAFRPAGSRTVVEVVHRGFLDDASRQTHLRGWISYFEGIAARC